MSTARLFLVIAGWSLVVNCGGKVDFVAVGQGGASSASGVGGATATNATNATSTVVQGTGGAFTTSSGFGGDMGSSVDVGVGGGSFSSTSNNVVSATSVGPSATTAVATSTGSGDVDGGGPPVINCEGQFCDAASQQCCVSQMGGSCIPQGSPCQGASLQCTGSSSCSNGEKCCAKLGGGTPKSACEMDCGGGLGNIQLCDSDADCTAPTKCTMAFAGLSICGGFGLGP